jgi:hypothetical protein
LALLCKMLQTNTPQYIVRNEPYLSNNNTNSNSFLYY